MSVNKNLRIIQTKKFIYLYNDNEKYQTVIFDYFDYFREGIEYSSFKTTAK